MATNTKNDDPKKADPKTEKGKAEAEQVEKIETNPVDVRDPYPTGAPADPERDFEAAHGFRRAPPEKEK